MFLFIIICQASEDGEDSTLEPEVKLGSVDYLRVYMICNIPKGMGMLGQFGRLFAMETLVSVFFMRLLEELIT